MVPHWCVCPVPVYTRGDYMGLLFSNLQALEHIERAYVRDALDVAE